MTTNNCQLSKKGKLFVICGPSGVGKKTIISEILKNQALNLVYSISYTSRAKRENEIEGVDYYFIGKEEFEKKIREGELVEYAEFFNNYYGTPKSYLIDNLNKGKNVLLEIETIGFKLVTEQFPDLVSIFILPPSVEDLRERLLKRNTERDDQIKIRLDKAQKEIEESKEFKYSFVNDDVKNVIDKITKVILSELV